MGLKRKIADWIVKRAIRKNQKSGAFGDLLLPIETGKIENVLVILPTQMELVENALNFFHRLKKTFENWKFVVLDVTKIETNNLNKLGLPNAAFLEKLKQQDAHLIIDLNTADNLKSIHIVNSLNAPYRLSIRKTEYAVYNLHFSGRDNAGNPFSHVIPALNTVLKTD
ncbi:MAG: hypothetical protein Kow0037_07610 [Calditrichia bacterium]